MSSAKMTLDGRTKDALSGYLLALGDDQFILGHRDSEWCGHAPILEEDIAFANIALDEIGHAHLWYGLLAEVIGEAPDTYPDQLVFCRPASAYCNVQMVELPKGDWAFSILRQYLSDSAELVQLRNLADCAFVPIAEIATKIYKEEQYHHRHTTAWIRRLGLGTEESHNRLQSAMDDLWPFAGQWLSGQPNEAILVEQGLIPEPASIYQSWETEVQSVFEECALNLPPVEETQLKRSQHTPHLKLIVDEIQSVTRQDPKASW